MKIQPVTVQSLDPFVDHLLRQLEGSGKDGEPIFQPVSSEFLWDADALYEKWETCLSRPIDHVSWGRAWVVCGDNQTIGHCTLEGPVLKSAGHRSTLAMGLERDWRGKGWGRRVLDEVLEWARREQSLSWIDLGVFAHNDMALRLYRSAGFEEVGRTKDRFRVDGQSIEDVQMTICVGTQYR